MSAISRPVGTFLVDWAHGCRSDTRFFVLPSNLTPIGVNIIWRKHHQCQRSIPKRNDMQKIKYAEFDHFTLSFCKGPGYEMDKDV